MTKVVEELADHYLSKALNNLADAMDLAKTIGSQEAAECQFLLVMQLFDACIKGISILGELAGFELTKEQCLQVLAAASEGEKLVDAMNRIVARKKANPRK